MRKLLVIVGLVASTLSAVTPTAALAAGGEGEAWPAFTESSSCGAQRVVTPHADESGWLARSDLLRGEFANMFGRTVLDVHKELELWEIPGSTVKLAVHPHVMPALRQVEETLNAALEEGNRYRITASSTYSTASRTIAGSIRTSRHIYGTAFDVNANKNPYRGDNVLISDMPEWWVDAFLDAGFCWGGLWIGSKDTMHFAWQGPAFSDVDTLPLPYEPLTDPAPLGGRDASIRVEPGAIGAAIATFLVDIDNNGAPDVVRLTPRGGDLHLNVSTASRQHNACSWRTYSASDLASRAGAAVGIGFGDWDGRGGQDLWVATEEDDRLRLTVRWAFGGYTAETSVLTDVPVPSSTAWTSTGDYGADGTLDLFIIDDGVLSVWAIDAQTGATAQEFSGLSPFDDPDHLFLGDRDLDNHPDLWAINDRVVEISLASSGFEGVDQTDRPIGIPEDLLDVRAVDYDGDGRKDLITFDGTNKSVWLGNTRLSDGLPLEVWFENEEPDCQPGEAAWHRQDLRFTSSSWVAEGSYEWRSGHGLEVGCNPEKDGCAVGNVTGRSFVEFMAWIDGVEPAPGNPDLAAARAVHGAGYVVPCALSDDTCWDGAMERDLVSSLFGQFLAQRRGDVPEPHRWLPHGPTSEPSAHFPG